jgi:hypothetical protein
MVTANFYYAPLPLVCYQNFYKALPANSGGLSGSIIFYFLVGDTLGVASVTTGNFAISPEGGDIS